MVWDVRNNRRSSQRLDEDLKRKISGMGSMPTKKLLLNKLRPTELLNLMDPVYIGTKEEIIQKERNDGQRSAAGMFLDKVPCYSGWGLAFLDALDHTGHHQIVQKLCPEYTPPPAEDTGSDHGDNPGDHPGNNDGPPPPYSENDVNRHHEAASNASPAFNDETLPKPTYRADEQIWQDQHKEFNIYNRNQEPSASNRDLNIPPENSVLPLHRLSTQDIRDDNLRDIIDPANPSSPAFNQPRKVDERAEPTTCPADSPEKQLPSSLSLNRPSNNEWLESVTNEEVSNNHNKFDSGNDVTTSPPSKRSSTESSASNSEPDTLDLCRESRMNNLEPSIVLNIPNDSSDTPTTSFNVPLDSELGSVKAGPSHINRSSQLGLDKNEESLSEVFQTVSWSEDSKYKFNEEQCVNDSNESTDNDSKSDLKNLKQNSNFAPKEMLKKEEITESDLCYSDSDSDEMDKDESATKSIIKQTENNSSSNIYQFSDEGDVLLSNKEPSAVATVPSPPSSTSQSKSELSAIFPEEEQPSTSLATTLKSNVDCKEISNDQKDDKELPVDINSDLIPDATSDPTQTSNNGTTNEPLRLVNDSVGEIAPLQEPSTSKIHCNANEEVVEPTNNVSHLGSSSQQHSDSADASVNGDVSQPNPNVLVHSNSTGSSLDKTEEDKADADDGSGEVSWFHSATKIANIAARLALRNQW